MTSECEVEEMPDLYIKVTTPEFKEKDTDKGDWIKPSNMEARDKDRKVQGIPPDILFSDDNFCIARDDKFRKDHLPVHVLCISKDPGIRSLRDLTSAHIDMLKQIVDVIVPKIEQRFPKRRHRSRLFAFIHYIQSTWGAFHVHVSEASDADIRKYSNPKRHYLLDLPSALGGGVTTPGVISHLQSNGSYYQHATLKIRVSKSKQHLYTRSVPPVTATGVSAAVEMVHRPVGEGGGDGAMAGDMGGASGGGDAGDGPLTGDRGMSGWPGDGAAAAPSGWDSLKVTDKE